MNVLKSFFGSVWGDSNSNELAKLTSGELYIVRPRSSIKGSRECIYNNAMATIRRASEFNYQLVITRVFEEDEEELLDENDETDDELVFLIGPELEFRKGQFENQYTFQWKDTDEGADVGDLYEFVTKDTNGPTRAFFETSVLKAIYEFKYHKNFDTANEAELETLVYKPPPPTNAASRPTPSVLQSHGASPSKGKAPAVSSPSATQTATLTDSQPESDDSIPGPDNIDVEGMSDDQFRVVHSEGSTKLFYFDYAEDAFALQGESEDSLMIVEIVLGNRRPFDYFLKVSEPDMTWLTHELNADLNLKWSKDNLAFRWNHRSQFGGLTAWCLTFSEIGAYERFKAAVNRCLWESKNEMDWDRAQAEEREYAKAYDDMDVEMKDAYDEEEEEEENIDDALKEEDEEEEEEEPSRSKLRNGQEYSDEEDSGDEEPAPPKGAKNSLLTVGYKGDRTFVVRGDRIGVFRHTDDDEIKYTATTNKVNTLKGKQFAPNKVMLHDQDRSMVLMNPNDSHTLYKMDLEYGKVVDEWKIHEDIPVSNFAPNTKFAGLSGEQTLLGASHNGLFRIDPRLNGDKLVDSEYKQYKSKNAFSSLTTTEKGGVAVASEKGDIRLFDSVGKIAKTQLPALGDPIIGVDVTRDGRYIVATCKTHLYLIDTLIGDGKYAGQLGFSRPFPAASKPVPKRLQLKPEHLAYMGSQLSFTPARFNTGPDQEETTIVTSNGPYVIAWDFKKVKAGKLDKYEIKLYNDTVVSDNFRFANDKDIVVALPDNVLLLNKKKLRKPTRGSLAPGGSGRKSSSNR
ncbi:hypothetical protein FRC03_000967 [Tulasnella sp. 419]|nr:hypothetical protein FRC03_000967 [Tulasnella sp. 419]